MSWSEARAAMQEAVLSTFAVDGGAVLRRAGSDSEPVDAFFRAPYVRTVEGGEQIVSSFKPELHVRESVLPHADAGDDDTDRWVLPGPVEIAGVERTDVVYEITDRRPDGQGIVVFELMEPTS